MVVCIFIITTHARIMNHIVFNVIIVCVCAYRLWPQSSAGGHFGSAAYHDMNVGPSLMGGDEAGESLSYNQRNIKKWETDEPLGDLATISPVLYANMCHPDLKIQFPG